MPRSPRSDAFRLYETDRQLARIREQILLGDVWKPLEPSYRDRDLVSCSVQAAGGKLDELQVWMRLGVEAGITLDELRGLAMQVSFYAGWPVGLTADKSALDQFEVKQK